MKGIMCLRSFFDNKKRETNFNINYENFLIYNLRKLISVLLIDVRRG